MLWFKGKDWENVDDDWKYITTPKFINDKKIDWYIKYNKTLKKAQCIYAAGHGKDDLDYGRGSGIEIIERDLKDGIWIYIDEETLWKYFNI